MPINSWDLPEDEESKPKPEDQLPMSREEFLAEVDRQMQLQGGAPLTPEERERYGQRVPKNEQIQKVPAQKGAPVGPNGERIFYMLTTIILPEGATQADIPQLPELVEGIDGLFVTRENAVVRMGELIAEDSRHGYAITPVCNCCGKMTPLDPIMSYWDSVSGKILHFNSMTGEYL